MGVILVMVVEGNITFVKYYLFNYLHKLPTNSNRVYLILNCNMMHYQHAQVFYYSYMIEWYMDNHLIVVIGSL